MVVVADQYGRKNVRNEEPAFLATAIKEGRTSRRKQLKMLIHCKILAFLTRSPQGLIIHCKILAFFSSL